MPIFLSIYLVIFTRGNIVHILHPSVVCGALALPLRSRGPKKKLSWRVIFKEILSLPNTTDPLECECRQLLTPVPSSKKYILCCYFSCCRYRLFFSDFIRSSCMRPAYIKKNHKQIRRLKRNVLSWKDNYQRSLGAWDVF